MDFDWQQIAGATEALHRTCKLFDWLQSRSNPVLREALRRTPVRHDCADKLMQRKHGEGISAVTDLSEGSASLPVTVKKGDTLHLRTAAPPHYGITARAISVSGEKIMARIIGFEGYAGEAFDGMAHDDEIELDESYVIGVMR